ncbi:hypothetical protein BSL78_01321 [Apostichopus japonicus]|uniref:Apple domain-containing protein n=1 Tax=Stichopus japonicus TaxID=307972 RepID=A0A2G8LND1_STIJA|nr:hypothetical protein BSL78_01321 [Apostichopus japonicus]
MTIIKSLRWDGGSYPNDGDVIRNCVVLKDNGKERDVDCTEQHQAVCVLDPSLTTQTPTTTQPTTMDPTTTQEPTTQKTTTAERTTVVTTEQTTTVKPTTVETTEQTTTQEPTTVVTTIEQTTTQEPTTVVTTKEGTTTPAPTTSHAPTTQSTTTEATTEVHSTTREATTSATTDGSQGVGKIRKELNCTSHLIETLSSFKTFLFQNTETPDTAQEIIKEEGVLSSMQCAVNCSQNNNCSGFLFHDDDGTGTATCELLGDSSDGTTVTLGDSVRMYVKLYCY